MKTSANFKFADKPLPFWEAGKIIKVHWFLVIIQSFESKLIVISLPQTQRQMTDYELLAYWEWSAAKVLTNKMSIP